MSPKFQIEPISLGDEAEVRAFLSKSISRPGAAAAFPPGWLAWLAEASTVAGVEGIPLGWKLIAGGELGGVHLIAPFRVAAQGGEALSIQSAGYYADPRWHGPASGALFLALMKFRSRYHCSVGTANEASSRVWQAFKAEELQGSGEEWCSLRLSAPLIEEALVRRARWMVRFLHSEATALRDSLPRRLESVQRRLGSAVQVSGVEAADSCAALPSTGGGAVPSRALLLWKLSAPGARCSLLRLSVSGKECAVFLTAGPRGHRGQTPALSVSSVWGPAWDSHPAEAMALLIRSARPVFPFITAGFGPVPGAVRPLMRSRKLDASRRWIHPSAAQPPLVPGWNGLDAL